MASLVATSSVHTGVRSRRCPRRTGERRVGCQGPSDRLAGQVGKLLVGVPGCRGDGAGRATRRIIVFEPVAIPGQGKWPVTEALHAEIAAWVRSEPLQALVWHFGGDVATGDLAEELTYLDYFAGATWDFRHAKKERNQIDADLVTGAEEELVMEAADALGLVRPRPPQYQDYDHVVVLGGLVPTGSIWRTAYAAHLLQHSVTAKNLTAISAYRELTSSVTHPYRDERELLHDLGLPRRTYEWEVMEDGLRQAFNLSAFVVEQESEPGAEGYSRFRISSVKSNERKVFLVAAPGTNPGHRANTADGYRYWVDRIADLQPGHRILAVTTCIYVPYQHAVALHHLGIPFACSIDTVGVDPRVVGGKPGRQEFRGVHYLQEIRSALKAYLQLLRGISGS